VGSATSIISAPCACVVIDRLRRSFESESAARRWPPCSRRRHNRVGNRSSVNQVVATTHPLLDVDLCHRSSKSGRSNGRASPRSTQPERDYPRSDDVGCLHRQHDCLKSDQIASLRSCPLFIFLSLTWSTILCKKFDRMEVSGEQQLCPASRRHSGQKAGADFLLTWDKPLRCRLT
jgi:hypothetical protein